MVIGYLFSVWDNGNLMDIVLHFRVFGLVLSIWLPIDWYELEKKRIYLFSGYASLDYSEKENGINYLMICDAVCICVFVELRVKCKDGSFF